MREKKGEEYESKMEAWLAEVGRQLKGMKETEKSQNFFSFSLFIDNQITQSISQCAG
jgi:hypothetical protein